MSTTLIPQEAAVSADDEIRLTVAGENVTVVSIHFWIQNVDSVSVLVFSEEGVFPAVDVSWCNYYYIQQQAIVVYLR